RGEGAVDDSNNFGFSKFATTLAQNYISLTNLELLGDTDIPMDCNLLIIAAPTETFEESELEKIGDYLSQGGRLLVMFNYASVHHPTGLETVLQRWGVNVLQDSVRETTAGRTETGQDVIIRKYGDHPVVGSLAQFSLDMILPRPVEKMNWR